jgi:hypothetical protein
LTTAGRRHGIDGLSSLRGGWPSGSLEKWRESVGTNGF